jgi:hypothetical protein
MELVSFALLQILLQGNDHSNSCTERESKVILVGFDVLTAVVMKGTIFRDKMPCNPLKFD